VLDDDDDVAGAPCLRPTTNVGDERNRISIQELTISYFYP
jgi:hypothetical protein